MVDLIEEVVEGNTLLATEVDAEDSLVVALLAKIGDDVVVANTDPGSPAKAKLVNGIEKEERNAIKCHRYSAKIHKSLISVVRT